MTDVVALVARLGSDRSSTEAIGAEFATWWAARDPQGVELLDELARRAGADAEAAHLLLTLVDRHGLARPALHRTLLDADDLADAEQATLAAVGLGIDRFDGRSRFTTWLHTVADNEAKMLIRSRDRRPATPSEHVDQSPFLARLSTILADRDLIERALSALPPDLRTTLELREIGGLDYDEIARTLDVEIGTVRSRLHRARHQLMHDLRATDD